MSLGKGSCHAHAPRGREKRSLLFAACITGVIMVVEVVGGFWANSLALISDAGHMFTDMLALLLSFFAVVVAARPATPRKTYGYHRLEILTALLNGLLVGALCVSIVYHAVMRIHHPPEVHGMRMAGIALIGLIANLAAVLVLSGSLRSLNVKGAFLHVLGDTLSSVGVIVGAVVIHFTGWRLLDPLLSLAIASVILYGAYVLVKEALDILLEGIPSDLKLEEVSQAIQELEMVVAVHDLHVWCITTGMPILSGHVVVRERDLSRTRHLLEEVKRVLQERFAIEHATIQVEPEGWEEPGHVC